MPDTLGTNASTSAYRFFDAQTARTFRAAGECIVPDEPESPGGGSERVLRVADAMLSRRPPADRRKIAAFLRALELLPLVRYGRRFSALRTEQRARVLAFLGSTTISPLLRLGAFGIKTYVLMGYYGSESTWAELSYPGPRTDAPGQQQSKVTA
jgi:hypothetical protein